MRKGVGDHDLRETRIKLAVFARVRRITIGCGSSFQGFPIARSRRTRIITSFLAE